MAGRVQFRPGDKFDRIEKRLEDPRVALKTVGVLVVKESRNAFRAQKLGNKRWDARAPINVFGLISDLSSGGKPAARRFDRRPALIDTGRLRDSISFEVKGDTVEIGTTVEYAGVHQTGGEVESEKITRDVQEALWEWLKGGEGAKYKRELGWLLNSKFTDTKLTAEVPARPFLGITDRMRKEIKFELGREIMEVG